MQYSFGSGSVWVRRTDVSVPTPHVFGVLQEIEVDFDQTVKNLHGQYQFPVDSARGTGKITGKAKIGRFDGKFISDTFFNVATATGQVTTANNEAQSVPAVSPFTIAVTNAADYVADLGVLYAATGLPLGRVAPASEVTGKYSVNEATGVYTFVTGDALAALLISYQYEVTATGQKFVATNQLLGIAPTFSLTLEQLGKTKKNVLILNRCMSNKLTLPTKLEDYTISGFEFSAYADDANNLLTWSQSEAT